MMRSAMLVLSLALAIGVAAPVASSGDAVAAAVMGRAEPAIARITVADARIVQDSGLPDRPAPARSMRAYWHVFIAFGITWVLLFGFAYSISRRFGSLEEEIHRMRDRA